MARLACRVCGKHLMHPCAWGGPEQRDETVADRQTPIPLGVMIRMEERRAPVCRQNELEMRLDSPNGAIALHPEAVVAEALVSCGTDNGCCGSDGLDGANRACTCGNVVGTEWSDCWTWAEIRFLPNAVVEVS